MFTKPEILKSVPMRFMTDMLREKTVVDTDTGEPVTFNEWLPTSKVIHQDGMEAEAHYLIRVARGADGIGIHLDHLEQANVSIEQAHAALKAEGISCDFFTRRFDVDNPARSPKMVFFGWGREGGTF